MSTVTYTVLKAYNPDLLLDVQRTFTTADETSADTTLTVESIVGFADGDYVLIGEFGQEDAEIVRISGSPSGTTLTFTASVTYVHARNTPVYRIDRNRVEFSRSTTLTGSRSVLATSNITPDSLYTIYEDTTNTTGFGWYRWNNQADSTFSNYSESIPYAGYTEQSLKKIFDTALMDLGQLDDEGQPEFPEGVSREVAFQAVVDAQQELAGLKTRWSHLTNFDVIISEIATGQDNYALPATIARENGRLAIWNTHIGSRQDMDYIEKEDLNKRRVDIVKDSLGAAITDTGATTITLSDVSDFDDSGSIAVIDDDDEGYDVIAYTGKTNSTNTLTGVTGIAETHANGVIVWQGVSLGEPRRFTIFEDTITIDPSPASNWNDYNLLTDMYIRPTVVNDLADEAQFPAFVLKPYVTWKLALSMADGNSRKKADYFRQLWEQRKKELLANERNGQVFKFKPKRIPDRTQVHPRPNVEPTVSTNT